MNFQTTFRDRTVWISGHTGFKGAWLCEWLLMLGARVHGYALEPPTDPALFEQLDLANRIEKHEIADVCNPDRVARSLEESEPDFVFHLAAQSLVRESYHSPRETFETNTIGTVNVLDALRRMNRRCVVIVVTTDKVYENREWVHAYRESDRLGGHDPYSASKAAAELVAASYRSSFFGSDSPVHLATARAGNVIGGGDWAKDRIVPDCIRASQAGERVEVRSPGSIRPWQHVLEPLSGYLLLAQEIDSASATSNAIRLGELCKAFNFGPAEGSARSVADLVEAIVSGLGDKPWIDGSGGSHPHEAGRLDLTTSQARRTLAWEPTWTFEETISRTVSWYRKEAEETAPIETTREQILSFHNHGK